MNQSERSNLLQQLARLRDRHRWSMMPGSGVAEAAVQEAIGAVEQFFGFHPIGREWTVYGIFNDGNLTRVYLDEDKAEQAIEFNGVRGSVGKLTAFERKWIRSE